MRLANYARDVETGDPFTTGSVQILGPDGASIATVSLNGVTGRWLYQANGQPGITLQEYTGAGQTRRMQGDAYGQIGDWMAGEIGEMMRFFHDGCFPNSEPALSAPGGMNVRVGPGMILNLGILHPIYANEDVAVTAAHATLARIDIVVSRLTRTGTFAGRVVLAVVAGTPGATPSAPPVTQTADTWEVKLGEIAVAAAAGAITSGNLSTTGRRYAGPPGRRLVGRRSFSAVSQILIDDLFTTEHDNYEVDIRVDSATANGGIYAMLRANRANNIVGYDYSLDYGYASDNIARHASDFNVATGWYFSDLVNFSTINLSALFRIKDPMRAASRTVTHISSVMSYANSDIQMIFGHGAHRTAAAFDGIRFYADVGTITGSLEVWATD